MFGGHPDTGPILTGFLGLFLIGAAFLAVGLFASSVTQSQVIAVVLSFAFLIIFLDYQLDHSQRSLVWQTRGNTFRFIKDLMTLQKAL